ncbi:MAG: hypothetical protein Q9211_004859 [Gyalolechia sp. 1 TL-2023]
MIKRPRDRMDDESGGGCEQRTPFETARPTHKAGRFCSRERTVTLCEMVLALYANYHYYAPTPLHIQTVSALRVLRSGPSE